MPEEVITDTTRRATMYGSIRSPVIGWMPPVARHAPITARSLAVTSTAHCATYPATISSAESCSTP